MIRLYFLCVFSTVFIAQGGASVNLCAHIIPQLPVVKLHTNFTAFCILNQTCFQEHNYKASSDELYWEVYTHRIPESQYTVINETVSSVTFEPTLDMGTTLTCSINVHGQIKTTLHGIFITLGLPPEKPSNLSCICYNLEKLTCTWNPGRPTIIATQYTVKQTWNILDEANSPTLMQSNITSYPASRAKGRTLSKYEYSKTQRPRRNNQPQKDCEAKETNHSCTLTYPDFQYYIDTNFSVEAKNDLCTVESDRITTDVIDILMPNPPEIVRVVSAAELQKALKIEWKNPMTYNLPLKYNLRYRTSDSTEWEEVPSSDINSLRTSYTLQGLQPYTAYVISLRCKQKEDTGFWSNWSKEYTATTPESTPSRGPELWRKISDEDEEGKRVVWLMWKVLPSYANGIILTYNVSIKKGSKTVDSVIVSGTSYNITVSRSSLQVSVTASNSYGTSTATTLIIPAANLVPQPAEIDVKAFPKDGKLWVEWSAPRTPVIGYVIEWCSNTIVMDCDFQWQREQISTLGAFLRGDLQPYTYYLIQVHPLYNDGQERPGRVAAYLEQKPPAVGPTVYSKPVEKTRAVLQWDPLPLEKRNGFIRYYIVKYSAVNGAEHSILVNATQTSYTLTNLLGKTVYRVSVTAHNDKGGTEGMSSTFVTHELDTGEIEAIVVSSCLGFLLFLLFGGLLFCKKRDMIKKHIWPNVPDPSKSNIAQWSPHTPSRHDSKSQPFQDDSFTDVSVVEITATKKSNSEQDLKSMDLMKQNTSEGLSSGIGGSSCMSQQLSLSERDEVESAQNTSSNVQYSTVIISGYRGQQPTAVVPPVFSRSESTQPLLDSEEKPDEVEALEVSPSATPNQYFKQNCCPEDGGRPQTLPPENPPTQEQLAQNQHLSGLSQEGDLQDCNAVQDIGSESRPTTSQMDLASNDMKSYLPQTARRGGYLPQ
ncbi:interleukin-6 receptor subunit beta isoform X2 [Pseudophryne corroboree]|uniref:interleukin-6 receptor subunit beta isoform X2 n=1 Tax=Pseudophryne corroboree TaxID=495146 RepID=UPI003081E682